MCMSTYITFDHHEWTFIIMGKCTFMVFAFTFEKCTATDWAFYHFRPVAPGMLAYKIIVSKVLLLAILNPALNFRFVHQAIEHFVNIFEFWSGAVGAFFVLHLVDTRWTENKIFAFDTRLRLVNETKTNRTIELLIIFNKLTIIYEFLKVTLLKSKRLDYLLLKLLMSHQILTSAHVLHFNLLLLIDYLNFE